MKVFFMSLLLLIGCASNPQLAKKRLHLSFYTHPTSLDPRKASDFVSSTLICMMYEGLTRCTSHGCVEQALAKSVEVKDDIFYLFHLRDAEWSDGTPITAYDFERSWKEIILEKGPCAFLFYPIKNAEKCARGEGGEVGIKALDAHTLAVELERPTPYFYALTAFPSFLAAPEDLSKVSGPFQIEAMHTNHEIVLKKNKRYWNPDMVKLNEIQISIVADESTALQMFERGELDWMGGSLSPLPVDAFEKLRHQIQMIPSAASTFCAFNTKQFPFDNKHLRQAFSYAIQRTDMQGGQIPAHSILPPAFSQHSFDWDDPVLALIHFEKALEELRIDRKDLESLTLYYRSTEADKRLAQMLQKRWKELLGVAVRLEQLEPKVHAQKLQAKD
ncbi:MAG: peptide ABC transporter substrate-binding protein, partial [Verrucomicrobiota bacterium]|nr:peptide ABC transporter substrate-binding protein [Verrucomicrobiota bacterium]